MVEESQPEPSKVQDRLGSRPIQSSCEAAAQVLRVRLFIGNEGVVRQTGRLHPIVLRGRDVGASTVGNCLHRALAAISAGPRGLFMSLRLSLGSISSLPLQSRRLPLRLSREFSLPRLSGCLEGWLFLFLWLTLSLRVIIINVVIKAVIKIVNELVSKVVHKVIFEVIYR